MCLIFRLSLIFLIRYFHDMPEVTSIEGMVSVRPRKRFGARYSFGCAVFGESSFGDDGTFGWIYGFGVGLFGALSFGSDDELTGIYQTRHWQGRVYSERMGWYWPKYNPSAGQQATRDNFAAAFAAWQALTTPQKAVYNKNAIGKHMSGYNLFISNFLKNN